MEEKEVLRVLKLRNDAILPDVAYESEGIDLYAVEDVEIKGMAAWGGTIKSVSADIVPVHTGIAMAIPKGYVGIIKEKSGLARKHKLAVRAGVIDSDYRGEIIVLLENHGWETVKLKKGTKIAQILLLKVLRPNIEEVKELDETDRGNKGFGSSSEENGGDTK